MTGGTAIPSDADMNDYTEIGNYYCNANSIAQTLENCPTTSGFTLKVENAVGESSAGSSGYIRQTFTEYDTGRKIVRYRVNSTGTWQPFVYFSDDATLKSNMQSPNFITDVESSTTLLELAQRRQNTWYSYPASVAPSDLPSYLTNSNVNYGIIVHTMSKVLTYITVYGVDQSNGVPCVITGCLVSAGDRIVWEDKT